jgi:CRISPR-associated protein Cas1
MEDFFLLESGFLGRDENTLTFENISIKRKFPIKSIGAIYILGEVSFNTKLINYLAKEQIPVFFFGYYGNPSGVFYPFKHKDISGKILVEQVKHFLDTPRRTNIAKEFVYGSLHNIRKTLMQYGLKDGANKMLAYIREADSAKKISNLLGIEANARKFYYRQFNNILRNKDYCFSSRSRNPPNDKINSLISFGNVLLYSTILGEICKTKLNPLISYLHEPFDNRYSLQLDIAEVFKPLIVDRVIFTLINKKIINSECFENKMNGCYLNKKGREKFIREYNDKLNQSLLYPQLRRKVSYRYILRKECYNLIEHFEGIKTYKSYKIYW